MLKTLSSYPVTNGLFKYDYFSVTTIDPKTKTAKEYEMDPATLMKFFTNTNEIPVSVVGRRSHKKLNNDYYGDNELI